MISEVTCATLGNDTYNIQRAYVCTYAYIYVRLCDSAYMVFVHNYIHTYIHRSWVSTACPTPYCVRPCEL